MNMQKLVVARDGFAKTKEILEKEVVEEKIYGK